MSIQLVPIKGMAVILISLLICPITIQAVSSTPYFQSVEISYATYFGGSGIEEVSEVACGQDGSVAIVGHTSSPDLRTSEDAFQADYSGGQWDIFVAKFDANGNLVFSSFLGGSGYEHVDDVVIRSDGSVVVVGFTLSLDFPVTLDAIQPSPSGETDGFIARISSDGKTLIYSTYYGGHLRDTIRSIRLDQDENYLVAGTAASTELATDSAFQTQPSGGPDLFIAKIAHDGSSTIMFSYCGGNKDDRIECLAIDSSNNYILSGQTSSHDFPTTEDAYQKSNSGGWDAFLTKLSSNGTNLLYSTYIGGSSEDSGRGVAVNSLDEIVVAGYTSSTDLSTLSPLQSEHAGGYCDILVYKCTSTGTTKYVTYLGGSELDISYGVVFDDNDRPIIVGRSLSDDFPINNSFQEQRVGHLDTTITMLTADGQTILFSSYIGGTKEDSGESISLGNDSVIAISGRTASADFPCTEDAYQTNIGGSYDVFLCVVQYSSSQDSASVLGPLIAVVIFSTVFIGIVINKWHKE